MYQIGDTKLMREQIYDFIGLMRRGYPRVSVCKLPALFGGERCDPVFGAPHRPVVLIHHTDPIYGNYDFYLTFMQYLVIIAISLLLSRIKKNATIFEG